jgi:hypothetical protein
MGFSRWWRPEPQANMWQKFEIEGIVHKEFVPPGQTVKRKFYYDVLRRMRENVRRKRPDKWRNNSWALHHDNTPAHASLVLQQFMASTNTTVFPHPPYSSDLAPCSFSCSRRCNWYSRGNVLTALKRSRPNRGTWRRRWREITSRIAFNHGNPLESLYRCQRGTTSKGMGANRNFG